MICYDLCYDIYSCLVYSISSTSAADQQSGTERGARFNFAKWHNAFPWLENNAGQHVTCDPCGTAHGMGLLASEPRLDLAVIGRGFNSWP